MSVRAVESRFNLRKMVAEETAARPLVLTQAPATVPFSQPAPPPASPKLGLRFDFSKIQSMPQPVETKAALKLNHKPAQFAIALNNSFQSNNNSKADVMRLTAVVDDLTSRLKKATDRAVMVETQLQKTQSAMLAERTNTAERINAANAQLGAAHATESQLRIELSKATKAMPAPIQPKTESFDNAVSALLTAESAVQKSKDEAGAMKSQLVAKDAEAKQMSMQIVELQTDSARANERSMQLHKQFSTAVHELSTAREAERAVVEERDRLQVELKKAKAALQQAVEAHAFASAEAAASAASAASAEAAASAAAAEAAASVVSAQAAASVALVDDHMHIENAPSTEVPVPPAAAMDPIKTHARYNRLRDKTMSLSASIARLQRSNQDDEMLPGMIENRNDLYQRAKALKAQYDTVFGATEPDSVVKLSGIESFVAPRLEDAAGVDAAGQSYHAPTGDAPDPCTAHTVSFAREMARNCPVGGAFDFGSFDCGVGVGNAMVKPTTTNHVAIGEEEVEDVEPTESHDNQKEMVNAVIGDLKEYLEHFKAEYDAATERSNKHAEVKTYN